MLSGAATAVPKTADGAVEMIRQVKIVKDTAVKARRQAIIVNAPAELRERLEPLDDKALLEECRQLRYESMSCPVDAACYTLRALADRHHTLDQQTRFHAAELGQGGVAVDALGIVVHDQQQLGCGVRAEQASERRAARSVRVARTRSCLPHPRLVRGRPRGTPQPRRPPPSQRSPAPHPHRPHAISRTNHRLRQTAHSRGQDKEGNPSLPEKAPDTVREIHQIIVAPYKTNKVEIAACGAIRKRGPWRTIDDIEIATLE